MDVSLTAELGRTTGSRPSKRLRREGKVPGVVYGMGNEPTSIAVEWKREGTRLTARLPPRASTRPEVLRVIVRDQKGVQLGRNFLEIEPSNGSERPDKAIAAVQ